MGLYLYERDVITGETERGILCADTMADAFDLATEGYQEQEDEGFFEGIKIFALGVDMFELDFDAYEELYRVYDEKRDERNLTSDIEDSDEDDE